MDGRGGGETAVCLCVCWRVPRVCMGRESCGRDLEPPPSILISQAHGGLGGNPVMWHRVIYYQLLCKMDILQFGFLSM